MPPAACVQGYLTLPFAKTWGWGNKFHLAFIIFAILYMCLYLVIFHFLHCHARHTATFNQIASKHIWWLMQLVLVLDMCKA
jgi:hypothetical protein